jgi:hypothetical protein
LYRWRTAINQQAGFAAKRNGEEEKGGQAKKKPRTERAPSVLILPSINSLPFLPPYIGGAIQAKKREEHQGLPGARSGSTSFPSEFLVDLFLFDHLLGYACTAPPFPLSPFPFSLKKKSVIIVSWFTRLVVLLSMC